MVVNPNHVLNSSAFQQERSNRKFLVCPVGGPLIMKYLKLYSPDLSELQ